MRHPAKDSIHRPPLRAPPDHLIKQFEQNGNMPLQQPWYLNEVYSESVSEYDKHSAKNKLLTFEQYDAIEDIMAGKKPAGSYQNQAFAPLLSKYKSHIEGRSMVVIGTQNPWIEKYSYHLNASKITTLDYNRAKWDNPRLEWHHVNDFLDRAMSEQKIEVFDNSASFSSIEHSGLGRYGDPLSPDGDIEAVLETHCLLRPGGLLFLALPVSDKEKGFIQFNAQRVYGESRLRLMFEGWTELERAGQGQNHMAFVLRKDRVCNDGT